MQFPINLVLEIRTQEEYDHVQEILQRMESGNGSVLDRELSQRVVAKLTDGTREARVLINGQQVAIGTTEEMSQRFLTECGMHQKSNVVLEEWQDGDYKSIRSRRLQRL